MVSQVLPEALTDPWAITEDDGRHFVVWLRAMADLELFRNDPIAANFGAVTPAPYKWLFLLAVWLGIDVVSWQLLVLAPSIVALTLWAANRFLGHYFPDPLIQALSLALMVYVSMDDLVAGLFALACERRIAAAEPLLTFAALAATLVGLATFLRSTGATGEDFSLA
ncbi:hypothetical protein [Aliiruegeria lutimaris]|uniref:Uncharacterized protein n=1 Tax=Aliiruegeria lutimaris TaxID=571298 RepID=A0A1G9IUR2_9RHOB|nr:hypothetical protein [Aliiruegeria lutimaris]SDL28806.1 hypothetical protein SAMN04488026_107625 [Aliiruegeria lutimaris]